MNESSRGNHAPPQSPVKPMRDELEATIATALPRTPQQFGAQLIKEKWALGIDPSQALLVTLDYDTDQDTGHDGVHRGQVKSSQSLVQVLLSNYQTVADGAFGETVFGLYTPPDVGPEISILDSATDVRVFNHDYEGIYRRTTPQTYSPATQMALRPADFKRWVWELELKTRYQAYLDQAWPSDARIQRPEPYALRTSVKAAFVMSACLQYREGSLGREGLALAMQVAGLPAAHCRDALTLAQLQAPTPVGSQIEAGRLTIYRYRAKDIWCFRHRHSGQVLLYVPANSSPLHVFDDTRRMRDWVVAQGRRMETQRALAAHFADQDLEDGTFHAGVLTALEGMAVYPKEHWLKKNAGFFNNDGYWDPQDYIDFERSPAGTDPFAQCVLSMKQAAMTSVETIRDDAQVNRDNLGAVVEPLVQWINRFGPLALFVPGGEGLLALAGIIDAGYGLDQVVNGKSPEQRSEGITRTVFGLLNALPLVDAGAVLRGEGTAAEAVGEKLHEPVEPARAPDVHPLPEVTAAPLSGPAKSLTRMELMRGVCERFALFSDEVIAQIARISTVDDDFLRLMQVGREPTPLLADTISRFRLDQELETVTDPVTRAQLFDSRYQALQQSDNEWVRLFQRQYPGLPKNAVEQIFDRFGLETGRPLDAAEALSTIKRLDGKAREYQGHARLNRAYEGLCLNSIVQAESDTLALHSLERLPGWAEGIRIDVLEGSVGGRVLDRSGPLESSDCRRLVKVGERYRNPAWEDSEAQGTDLFTALFDLLSAQERRALSVRSPRELKRSVGEWALPRSEFMSGLNRMHSGLPFQARGLRGGGFPDTPQGVALNHGVKRLLVKDLYPDFTDAQADEWLYRAGGDAQGVLDRLGLQLEQLRTDLNTWIDQSMMDVDDMDVDFLEVGDEHAAGMNAQEVAAHNDQQLRYAIEYERETRMELATELIAIWQKCPPQANSVFANEVVTGYRLDLGFEDYHRLPHMNVRFDDVIELSMQHLQLIERESLNTFLESFPNLRVLNLERVDLRRLNADDVLEGVLPPSIVRMTRLISLNLKSTFLEFKESTAGQLSALVNLQMLDLSDNPLVHAPVLLGLHDLRVLNLRKTRISRCPLGIVDEPRMTSLDLRDNRISRVPETILNQAVSRDRVRLWGNPLTEEDSLLRLVEHRERTGINLWLSEPGEHYGTVTPWLEEGDEVLRGARRQIWQRIARKPSGAGFLRVMDGLSLTADFKVRYWLMQARVWRLLSEADALDELWGWLSHCVETTPADAQNPFRLFGVLEDRARVYHHWVAMGRPIPMPEYRGS
ncbi:dermonecrotic toxin domain-containing protein [Pseudomonas sp. NPDC089569]|uniref:dermonecrotic toxin domain-containing protein n=1 Tax=Pseudomonas sp. NPDC089569 TaxID=3390722 RepID=UPI003CFFEC23